MTGTEVLDVPTYSQEMHIGDYAQWDGGGEAWCSPTSTSMVVGYSAARPEPGRLRLGDHRPPRAPTRWVDYAARHTFDYAYDGAGNWPFNTAYAARFGLEGFVTRLRDLARPSSSSRPASRWSPACRSRRASSTAPATAPTGT